jgi:hypothetical protein
MKDNNKEIVDYFLYNIQNLSMDEFIDLKTTMSELMECNCEEEFEEISQTVCEIMFPDEFIGGFKP